EHQKDARGEGEFNNFLEIPGDTNSAPAFLASFLSAHPYYEYGGDDRTIAGGARGSGCGCGPASPRRPERSRGPGSSVPESAVSVLAAHGSAERRSGRLVSANMVESGRKHWFLRCKPQFRCLAVHAGA